VNGLNRKLYTFKYRTAFILNNGYENNLELNLKAKESLSIPKYTCLYNLTRFLALGRNTYRCQRCHTFYLFKCPHNFDGLDEKVLRLSIKCWFFWQFYCGVIEIKCHGWLNM